MKKEYGYPTLKVICQASAGNETAIREILKFYDAYICKLCFQNASLICLCTIAYTKKIKAQITVAHSLVDKIPI